MADSFAEFAKPPASGLGRFGVDREGDREGICEDIEKAVEGEGSSELIEVIFRAPERPPDKDGLREDERSDSSIGVLGSLSILLIFSPASILFFRPRADSPSEDARERGAGVGGESWPWSIMCSRAANSLLWAQGSFRGDRAKIEYSHLHILHRMRRCVTLGVLGVETPGVFGNLANMSARRSEPSPSNPSVSDCSSNEV